MTDRLCSVNVQTHCFVVTLNRRTCKEVLQQSRQWQWKERKALGRLPEGSSLGTQYSLQILLAYNVVQLISLCHLAIANHLHSHDHPCTCTAAATPALPELGVLDIRNHTAGRQRDNEFTMQN